MNELQWLSLASLLCCSDWRKFVCCESYINWEMRKKKRLISLYFWTNWLKESYMTRMTSLKVPSIFKYSYFSHESKYSSTRTLRCYAFWYQNEEIINSCFTLRSNKWTPFWFVDITDGQREIVHRRFLHVNL